MDRHCHWTERGSYRGGSAGSFRRVWGCQEPQYGFEQAYRLCYGESTFLFGASMPGDYTPGIGDISGLLG
jgi:hypothetical protein